MSLDDLTDEQLMEWFGEVMARSARDFPMSPVPQSYGPAPEHVIDWWGPDDAELVVASIHGGYFAADYDRSVNEPLSRMLAAQGLLVGNIDYRRAGSCVDPMDTVSDVRDAIGAVVARASGRPVVVTGHSAGGYLAIAGSTVDGIAASLPLSPATDLVECSVDGWDDGAIANWIGCEHAQDPDRWSRMDLDTVGIGSVPLVVVHGVDDGVVPAAQSTRFGAGRPGTRVDLLEGNGHFEFLDPTTAAAALVADWIRRLASTA